MVERTFRALTPRSLALDVERASERSNGSILIYKTYETDEIEPKLPIFENIAKTPTPPKTRYIDADRFGETTTFYAHM
jgi:hypothetical protein